MGIPSFESKSFIFYKNLIEPILLVVLPIIITWYLSRKIKSTESTIADGFAKTDEGYTCLFYLSRNRLQPYKKYSSLFSDTTRILIKSGGKEYERDYNNGFVFEEIKNELDYSHKKEAYFRVFKKCDKTILEFLKCGRDKNMHN